MKDDHPVNCVRADKGLEKKLKIFGFSVGGLALVIGVSSMAGWLPDWLPGSGGGSCPCENFPAALLTTVQLFVLNVGADTLCSFWSWAAAALAPLATLGGVFAIFSHSIATRWHRHRLAKAAPQVVFLGCGSLATSIALRKYGEDAASKSDNVVFVDSSPAPLIHNHLKGLNCKRCDWHGNALTGEVLSNTNATNAVQVWVLTGDDKRNLEIAQKLVLTRQKAEQDIQPILVNVDDQELVRNAAFAIGDISSIRFFSIKQLAARYLLLHFSPRLPVSPGPVESPLGENSTALQLPQRLHIAIVGNGDLVNAIVELAIVHFIYSDDPENCIIITLFGENASQRLAEFQRRHPMPEDHLNEKLSAVLPIVQMQAIDCLTSRIGLKDWKACQEAVPFAAVYINESIDLNTIAATMRTAALRELQGQSRDQKIVSCFSQANYDDAAFNAGASLPENVEAYNLYDCVGTDESYPGEAQDVEAMLINLAFADGGIEALTDTQEISAVEKARNIWKGEKDSQKSADPESPQGTDEQPKPLAEMFRRSNRFAADHIVIKLILLFPELAQCDPQQVYSQALELIESDTTQSSGIPSQALLKLMKLEHRRFVVERLVDGWLPVEPATGEKDAVEAKRAKNKMLQLNETLVPFDELPSDQIEKDKLIVECITEILKLRVRGNQSQSA